MGYRDRIEQVCAHIEAVADVKKQRGKTERAGGMYEAVDIIENELLNDGE